MFIIGDHVLVKCETRDKTASEAKIIDLKRTDDGMYYKVKWIGSGETCPAWKSKDLLISKFACSRFFCCNCCHRKCVCDCGC